VWWWYKRGCALVGFRLRIFCTSEDMSKTVQGEQDGDYCSMDSEKREMGRLSGAGDPDMLYVGPGLISYRRDEGDLRGECTGLRGSVCGRGCGL
jgi:hypothetical protein